ncbi:MAG: tetratricopeptide repeat protein [Magnetococcales bacterium]|nr:tetratricopeptide repeat protein [Magnetococcales bacterium]
MKYLFHDVSCCGVILLLLGLTGCSSVSPDGQSPIAPVTPAVQTGPLPDAEASRSYQEQLVHQYLLGQFYLQEQDWQNAEAAMGRVVELDPSHSGDALETMMHLALQRGALPDAVRHARQLLQHKPDHRAAHLLLARILSAEQKHAEAIQHYEVLLRLEPNQVRLRLVMARVYGLLKQPKKADEVIRPLLGRSETAWRARVAVGSAYVNQGDMDSALRQFQDAHRRAPRQAEPVLAAGAILQIKGRYREAEQLYRLYLARDPGNEMVQQRVRQLKQQQDHNTVMADFQASLRNAPDSVQANLATAVLLLGQDSYADALKELRLAEAVQPDNAGVRFYLGMALEGVQQSHEAMQQYTRVPAGEPFFIKAQIRMALIEAGEQQLAAAITRLRALDRGDTKRIDLALALATLLLQDSHWEEVVAISSRILQQDPEQWRFLYMRATAYDKLNRWVDAERDLRLYIDKNPDDAQALNYLGYVWAERNENLQESYDLLQRAIKLSPGDGFITDSLGWVLFRLQRFDEALRLMREAVRLQPKDSTITEHLGDVLLAAGQPQEALDVWQKALELDQNNAALREKILRHQQQMPVTP